jgi:hypothetical protein
LSHAKNPITLPSSNLFLVSISTNRQLHTADL